MQTETGSYNGLITLARRSSTSSFLPAYTSFAQTFFNASCGLSLYSSFVLPIDARKSSSVP